MLLAQFNIEHSVYFDTDIYSLTKTEKTRLQKFLSSLSKDEVLKIEIFSDIIIPNKCWYCGAGEMKDMDHFIPTNGRLFKPPMFGLEHEGNMIPSCKVCNANKSNKHPIEWLKKGRTTKGKEFSFPKHRVEAFELFFDLFKDKLIADKELTSIITDQVIPKCESSTQELAGFLNWIKL